MIFDTKSAIRSTSLFPSCILILDGYFKIARRLYLIPFHLPLANYVLFFLLFCDILPTISFHFLMLFFHSVHYVWERTPAVAQGRFWCTFVLPHFVLKSRFRLYIDSWYYVYLLPPFNDYIMKLFLAFLVTSAVAHSGHKSGKKTTVTQNKERVYITGCRYISRFHRSACSGTGLLSFPVSRARRIFPIAHSSIAVWV